MSYRKLWIALGVIIAASFAVLGGVGYVPQAGAPGSRPVYGR